MGYARVSSKEQNLDRQILQLKKYVQEENIIVDKASGKNLERPGYQALKGVLGLRQGDTLVITSLDRLSRSKTDIKQELQWFKEHGIRLMILDLPTSLIEIPEGQEWMGRLHYDFDTKKTIRTSSDEWYVYEHKVPETVSEELWERANENIRKRRSDKKAESGADVSGKNAGKYHLSGKIQCGLCGSPYYRRIRRRYKTGEIIHEWKCRTYLETGRNTGRLDRPQLRRVQLEHVEGCDNVHLDEERLYQLLEKNCLSSYQVDKEKLTRKMIGLLKTVLKEQDLQPEIDRVKMQKKQIKEQTKKLVDKLLDGVLSDQVYTEKQKELDERLENIQAQLNRLEKQNNQKSVLKYRILNIEESLKNGDIIEKASVAGMLEEIDRIVVFPTYLELHFNLSKMIGVTDMNLLPEGEQDCIRIEYDNLFNYRQGMAEEREQIVQLLIENPDYKAKDIARELDYGLSKTQYRMKVLQEEGRIQFHREGMTGYWEVLK